MAQKKTWHSILPHRTPPTTMTPRKKLSEYHALTREMIDRAYRADADNQKERALSLYRHSVAVIQEAFRLEVPSSGLGPIADTTASIRQDLGNLHEHVLKRIIDLESVPTQRAGKSSTVPRKLHAQKIARKTERQKQNLQTTASAVADSVRRVGKAAREAMTGEAAKHREQIMGEMLITRPGVEWDDIAGVSVAKQALYESVILPSQHPDLFQGLRAPPRGLLLYGPPGNGKTLLAKALASKAQASFFNISASSLTSKWVGEGEKLVRTLFVVAAEMSPSIIFIDEIDSILSSRSQNESDASRKLKTEFLVQFDGLASASSRILVIGATNRPHELDDAALRRLVKRIHIPLPSAEARTTIVQNLFEEQKHSLTQGQLSTIVTKTDGYSASDLTALCKEASMVAIRELGPRISTTHVTQLRPVSHSDFTKALKVIKPSVNTNLLKTYQDFTRDFGSQS